MVSQCANPNCERELRYLREGKIYAFRLSTGTKDTRLEHFWLCGECSKRMILTCVDDSEFKTARCARARAPRILVLQSRAQGQGPASELLFLSRNSQAPMGQKH